MNFIDDGKLNWEQVYNNLKDYIKNYTFNYNNYSEIYKDIKLIKDFIYDIIHNKLVLYKSDPKVEEKIRELCKYVIGTLLPFVNKNLDELDKLLQKEATIETANMMNQFLELEDDLYAIASFRSLIHFAHYMERQDDKSQLVWKYNMNDTMGSIFYYSNKMILDHEYQNLLKQCPTGYGKSKSDCVIISFCFGYNSDDDVGKWVGNKTLVKPTTQAIVKMLRSKKFGKVFPQFGKYDGSMKMFKNCAETDGTFTLTESTKAMSFGCFNKETDTNGLRFNKQFFDDITQAVDRENTKSHKKDWERYKSEWSKRQYDTYSVLRWATGTSYHREDFLSRLIKEWSNGQNLIKLSDKKLLKYGWSKFVEFNQKKNSVFIRVPKLADLDLGEDKCYCTFPQKYSKEEALAELHGSMNAKRRFMAMEQQKPLPPETQAFDYAFLQQYETLSEEIKNGFCETIVVIDPNRRGGDNYAGLIFKKPNSEDKYYLVDCYYKKVGSKYAVPGICERASFHKAHEIIFEKNTCDAYQMKKALQEELIKHNWNEAHIGDFYSTLNKEEKISMYRDDVRDKIVFPRQGMYYEDSDMGRAMADITNYSFEGKNGNDDSIDCCVSLIIYKSKKTKNTIETFNFFGK